MANSNKPKNNYAGDTKKVSSYDVCQTPPHALEPLYPLIDKTFDDPIIWEPACGPERIIQDTLYHLTTFRVIGTDLLYGNNFFEYQPKTWDMQITNPPWSIKYKWIQRSFELGKPFALLVPYETTAAAIFQRLADEYNDNPWSIEILAPERRINFKMPNKGWNGSSAQMPTIWLTWGLNVEGYYGPPYIKTFEIPMRSVRYDSNNKPIEKRSK